MRIYAAVFYACCSIGSAFLAAMCSPLPAPVPAISSAVATSSDVTVLGETMQPPEVDKPYQLLPAENVEMPITPDKPLYDPWLVDERKEQGWPVAMSSLAPYYQSKTVYLTFDDGPDPENTPRVLSILETYHVKATFFLIGTQAQTYPALVQRLFTAGHAIGNHSYNHRYQELYQSVDTYIAQLEQTDAVLKNILGVRPRISRAPGGTTGSFTAAYWQALRQNGYVDVGWNISAGDAAGLNAPQIVASVKQQCQNKALWNHAIILMHDGPGHDETIKALPEIIEYLQNQGFSFRVITPLTPPAW